MPTQNETNGPLTVEGELRLLGCLSERLFQLLAAIESTGSINRASREVGMTYKGAWQLIERANNASPAPLISKKVGGQHGGGSQLTPSGKALLALFLAVKLKHRRFIQNINERLR